MEESEKLIRDLTNHDWAMRAAAVEQLGKLACAKSVVPLIDALRDKDSTVRRNAAKALGEIGDPRAVEPLIKAIDDIQTWVQESSVWALGMIGDARAVTPIIACLKDRSWSMRRSAIEALARMRDIKAVEPLLQTLEDSHPSVRCAAVLALGLVPNEKAAGLIVTRLSDIDVDVRQAAAKAFESIGDAPTHLLVACLRNENPSVRRTAARLLGRKGKSAMGPILDAIESEASFVTRESIQTLGVVGNAKAAQLLALMLSTEQRPAMRGPICKALIQIGAPSVQPLVDILSSEDSRVVRMALGILRRIGDARAVEPMLDVLRHREGRLRDVAENALHALGRPALKSLVETLDDERWHVREASVRILDALAWEASNESELISYLLAKKDWNGLVALGRSAILPLVSLLAHQDERVRLDAARAVARIEDPIAVEPLANALRDNVDPDVRKAIVGGLARIGTPEAVEVLTESLVDTDSRVAIAAVEALEHTGNLKAIDALTGALKGETTIVEAAVKALGRMGDARAAGPILEVLKRREGRLRDVAENALLTLGGSALRLLKEALTDEQSHVREAGVRVLDRLGWKASEENELISYLLAKKDWNGLVILGKPAITPLVGLLDSRDKTLRLAATAALGRIGDAGTVKSLLKMLTDSEEDMRKAAADSLGAIGDSSASKPLVKALADNKWIVREAAAIALGRIGYAGAVDPLIEALNDNDSDVSRAAVIALGKIGDAKAIDPLVNRLGSSDPVTVEAVAQAVEQIRMALSKISGQGTSDLLCSRCFCRVGERKAYGGSRRGFSYFACRSCRGSQFIDNVRWVTAILDRSFDKPYTHTGSTLRVNWNSHKDPFDFDEIRIIDVNDFDIDELVMKLRNDMDDKRRKRYKTIPVHLSSHLQLSQAKIHMLQDTFGGVERMK